MILVFKIIHNSLFVGSRVRPVSRCNFGEDEDEYKHFLFLVFWIKMYVRMNE